MNFLNPDFIGGLIGFALTLAILSYLIGDNPVYRVAVHIFVGVTAGYAALIAFETVIWPSIFSPFGAVIEQGANADWGTVLSAAITLLLSVFFLLKTRPATTSLGSVAVAFMVGVGAAVAIGGTITGTLFPQTSATFIDLIPLNGFSFETFIEGIIIITGTIATLSVFLYTARAVPGQPLTGESFPFLRPVQQVGQIFIGIAFGVMYAGALAASLAVFVERLDAMQGFILSLMGAK